MGKQLRPAIVFKVLIALLLTIANVYGVFGLMFNKDLFTLTTYDEMDGLMPYIVLLVSAPLSLVYLLIALIVKRRNR